ncbi:MAG TPA: hypothetical protein VJH97_01685 [Candidatus Nanoarchaeia archaeon]|nr:hypothetical protein [Candidatus Nanoarchaeia archaeon]
MAKQIISMNVDSHIYAKYAKFCREKGIVMSKQVENFMEKFLKRKEL